jgi:hypothetical protein
MVSFTARHPAITCLLSHSHPAPHAEPAKQSSNQPCSAYLHAVAQVPQQVLQRVQVSNTPPQGLGIEHCRIDVGQPPGARLAPQAAAPPGRLDQPAGAGQDRRASIRMRE